MHKLRPDIWCMSPTRTRYFDLRCIISVSCFRTFDFIRVLDHLQINVLALFHSQDQKLTKEEILENWNMFVGSQATNYGEDLTRNHDEL